MLFPQVRLRRLRKTPSLRSLVHETHLLPSHLVKPFFIVPGKGVKREVSSLPGQYQWSIDTLLEGVTQAWELGIKSCLLFAIPETKDEEGSSACCDDGIIQESIKIIKQRIPEITVITDLCFCEYTSHGHCGIMKNGELQNDETLEILVNQALSHAQAGADIIAPSGMVDGTVMTLRAAFDEHGYSMLPIMAYSTKFASAFYGPFREAVQSSPGYGDRKGYQMNPANRKEAIRESLLDLDEGADILMIKPALSYLDIIREVADQITVPLAAYNVSGEYAMIKAAARNGWIDGERVMTETLISMKRAGADIIITYFAEEYASLWKKGALL